MKRNHFESIDLSPLSSCPFFNEIVLGGELKEIDLSPLALCSKFKTLNLNGNQLKEIDLSPLSKCANFRELHILENNLENIDLAPLSSCSKLEIVNIEGKRLDKIDLIPLAGSTKLETFQYLGTKIKKIDLSPLSSCHNLIMLDLRQNKLTEIDLSALKSCAKIQEISLDNNRLKSIDFRPLEKCTDLKYLTLRTNRLRTIDLTPLRGCHQLHLFPSHIQQESGREYCSVDTIMNETSYGNSRFRKILRYDVPFQYQNLAAIEYTYPLIASDSPWKAIHLFHETLRVLGISWLGLIDTDVSAPLQAILNLRGRSIKRKAIAIVEPLLCEQIDNQHTTIGVDFEQAVLLSPNIASRAQMALELRAKEMQQISVSKNNETVDLRGLWLTANGYRILSSLQIGTRCSFEEFETLSIALNELGYEIEVLEGKGIEILPNISENLRDYIWYIADFHSEFQKYPKNNS